MESIYLYLQDASLELGRSNSSKTTLILIRLTKSTRSKHTICNKTWRVAVKPGFYFMLYSGMEKDLLMF